MVFSDTSTYQGIVQDIDFLLFGSSTATSPYPIADKVRNVNRRFDEITSLLLEADGRWKWDDTNNAAQPATTINLSDGVTASAIPDTTYLTVNRMEVKNSNGDYKLITPIHEKDIKEGLTEFMETAGMPLYYEKVGGFVNLYPKPSASYVTLTAGLKVYYQRSPSYFAAADTTKVPGFAAPFHRLLSIGAALDYAITNGMTTKVNILTTMLEKLENKLVSFYSSRSGDEKVSLKLNRGDYGDDDTDDFAGVSFS